MIIHNVRAISAVRALSDSRLGCVSLSHYTRYPLVVGVLDVGAGTRYLLHSARSCELAFFFRTVHPLNPRGARACELAVPAVGGA